MADISKPIAWPSGAWKMLKKIIQAWYTVEDGGGEISQKEVAQRAGIQASRLSMNKPFLRAIGVIESEGIALTDEGKRLGLGLANDNELVVAQALQNLVRTNPLLKGLWATIRARKSLDTASFEAEVLLQTKQGRGSDYFGTGVNVLEDILVESGLVVRADNGLRSVANESFERIESAIVESDEANKRNPEFNRIPIPVSPGAVWYVEVGRAASEAEIQTFLNVPKMIFGIK
jgi:hypothetical protein